MDTGAGDANEYELPREIIYMSPDADEAHCWWISGITFREFVRPFIRQFDLIVFEDPNLEGCRVHPTNRFTYCTREDLPYLVNENIYDLGDFCWVDFQSRECLDALAPQDVAELLYLAHMWQPMGSPFSSVLLNRFVYLGHDDGWLLKLYALDTEDLVTILAHVIADKHSRLTRTRRRPPVDSDICSELLSLVPQGLLLHFRGSRESSEDVADIAAIGSYEDFEMDMDNVWDRYQDFLPRAVKRRLYLIGSSWKIQPAD